MTTRTTSAGIVLALLLPAGVGAAPDAIQASYRAQGAGPFDAQAGASAWQRNIAAAGETRSCSTCHGADPRQPGRHPRTGKRIEPLAPSANPQALADEGNVEKWFARNCKWTWGRECSAQEKGDLVEYLKQL
jgi:mono/diheme cytochrome c family protein